ncbi:unnamed protein product [Medioppia subpectinata]|uniref:Uncharacterized protein n=1 Tax=Medioppia subpectinata TaxID=1979941 RepID=A0A7R9KYM5_9ACAR|nr:unnamed protein product [Medioppia subpectinata]CAD7631554.1 unnamed protein product [Medioppia subpectinata]CAG2111983.1 unnamed protein product [Medioppia subpectinata]CAG2111984.1 unnamed protein product [Medioppia subpectinata]
MNWTVTGLQEWFLKEDNESVVKNEDFPQMSGKDVAAETDADSREAFQDLISVWVQMGLSTHDMMNRMKEIKQIHSTANRNALKTDTSRLERLIQYTDTKLSKIDAILADLTLPSFRAPTHVSREELGRILVYKFSELEALKKERLNQLTELKSKRDKLLKKMNMKAKELRTATNIPCDEELMHLQSYVSDLTKELSKRFNKYKKIIEKLFKELERDVNSDFEKHLLFEGSDDFILSDDHMKRLATLHSELETCYQQNADKRAEMEKRLDSLWNKLEVEQSYRDAFYRNKNGCKPSVLALLADEVNKYEEPKPQNIQEFIETMINNNDLHLATTRSTPASPQPKLYGVTPSPLPRNCRLIPVAPKKRPFIPF